MGFPNTDNCITIFSDGVAAIPAFTAVRMTAAATAAVPGVGDSILGIAQQGVALGDTTTPINVCITGITHALAGAAITNILGSQPLMVEAATGRLVTFVAAGGNTHCANYIPMPADDDAADGDVMRVQLVNNPLLT